MTNPIFSNEEVNVLYALRSRGIECKSNFKQKYLNSDLLCPLCLLENEDQKHILTCSVIQNEFENENISNSETKYENIFSNDVRKQKEITSLYTDLLKIRERLIKENSQEAPSSTAVELTVNSNLPNSIVYSLFGK